MKVRTRFAPSPTGFLHIGGLRTALFNYLWAKRNKGEFLLRIEDTDQNRLVKGADKALEKILKQVGLVFDKGPYYQSKRLKKYETAAKQLLKNKQVYYCFCSSDRLDKLRKEQQANKEVPKYDGHCRNLSEEEVDKKLKTSKNYVVRFKIPEDITIDMNDLVYGNIQVKSRDLDDFVILKSDKFPTYHLANVVDDHDMKISHVIRGEEWLPSLPKHILLYNALGYDLPYFAHLPLLLNPDKSKLSKRQGDVAVEDFLAKGYLAPALINYCALLGWNPGDDREMFSLKELEKEFTLEKVNNSGAVFSTEKLNWFNAEYIRQIIEQGGAVHQKLVSDLKELLPAHKDRAEDLLKLFGSRLNFLSEIPEKAHFLFKLPAYEAEMLVFKKSDKQRTIQGLTEAKERLEIMADSRWNEEKINNELQSLVDDELQPGDIFWPVRVAVSGMEKSPSPPEILAFLGRKDSITRLEKALKKLK